MDAHAVGYHEKFFHVKVLYYMSLDCKLVPVQY